MSKLTKIVPKLVKKRPKTLICKGGSNKFLTTSRGVGVNVFVTKTRGVLIIIAFSRCGTCQVKKFYFHFDICLLLKRSQENFWSKLDE